MSDDEAFDWSKLAGTGHALHGRTTLQNALHYFRAWAPTLFATCVWIWGVYAAGGKWGGPYVCVSALLFFFCNTSRKRRGELSAYSVFNPNFQRSAGQLTSADFDRTYRGGGVPTPLAERGEDAPLFGSAWLEGRGQRVGGGEGGGSNNALLAQLAAERRAREAAAAARKRE